jgi:hypothetical protein
VSIEIKKIGVPSAGRGAGSPIQGSFVSFQIDLPIALNSNSLVRDIVGSSANSESVADVAGGSNEKETGTIDEFLKLLSVTSYRFVTVFSSINSALITSSKFGT